ncbi:MerR family transcriptional regulator [Streptomyces sp. SCSIO ZS0520]|uniref:MerR family transcriptional regulator n=1 Tax=Streptomyces sp. SCSIO ZS0520 TaxID=2892996 RepID=UPI00295300A2|nr:MerR family transcriptional regulator [Streptomyces sp. SCSIO ZS0520]
MRSGEEAMRIGDAAAAAGTTPRALRFYEQNGLLPAPVRSASGQRVYGSADLARIRVVRELLGLGLTVRDVRRCADRLDELAGDPAPRRCGGTPHPGTAHVVAGRVAALDAEIDRLTRLRDQLAAVAGQFTPAAEPAPAGVRGGGSRVGPVAGGPRGRAGRRAGAVGGAR